mmetsp:Transcript_2589/g.2925  ORF Transcript_2589/g.2925 Transcript_2589/m.2925 type:complete len:163 (+) Transcript_2589:173-661(+)|eukprot:CAMPEP_0184012416 /NCGR_PEP_ID=MMETSP0954-20121128/4401_1 /TAXON_ID=627963 /ORGANISM="Aplanochytrium sp, Strain PBS07" /LENGTH=162 /DNA_ID=CAMNT_0026292403 /DNA_START=132 /DNA_END=620 /DNA_ORIENTATION=-
MRRIEPKPGQESVWDYPRPPKLEKVDKEIRVIWNGKQIANTNDAYRILETSHPPVYYIPASHIQQKYLKRNTHRTFCEWKGQASYYDLVDEKKQTKNAGWYYHDPVAKFSDVKDYVAFYPSKMDACFVNGEQVQAQEGDFYGGWITKDIVGPFKGGPGTWGW